MESGWRVNKTGGERDVRNFLSINVTSEQGKVDVFSRFRLYDLLNSQLNFSLA